MHSRLESLPHRASQPARAWNKSPNNGHVKLLYLCVPLINHKKKCAESFCCFGSFLGVADDLRFAALYYSNISSGQCWRLIAGMVLMVIEWVYQVWARKNVACFLCHNLELCFRLGHFMCSSLFGLRRTRARWINRVFKGKNAGRGLAFVYFHCFLLNRCRDDSIAIKRITCVIGT